MAAPNTNPMAMTTQPKATEGVVEYKPSEGQQKVINILGNPTALAVLAPLIPKGVDREAVFVEVYRAAAREPKILRCTHASIVMAVADCLRVGLTIGKTIHLVPLEITVKGVNGAQDTKELQLQAWTDYKGDIELVVGSGAARMVDSHEVYANDHFKPHYGTDPRIEHVPALSGPRGAMIGAYSVAHITATIKKVCWMRLDQIEAIRAKSRSWKPRSDGTNKDCPPWYAKKTTVHAICKDLPKNPKLAAILAVFARQDELEHEDEAEYTVESTTRVPTPAAAAQPSFDEHGEADRAVTREPEPTTVPDVPQCPLCRGEMYDNRAANDEREAKGERLWPDFKCKNAPKTRGGEGCEGKYWRGEWPKDSDDQDEFVF